MRLLTVSILVCLLFGCVVNPEGRTVAEQDRHIREMGTGFDPLQQRLYAIPSTQRKESIDFCRHLNGQQDSPYGCYLTTIGLSLQVMFFTFPDAQTLNQNWQYLGERLGVPYCFASLNMHMEAALGQILLNEDVLRIALCNKGFWSEWMKADMKRGQHY